MNYLICTQQPLGVMREMKLTIGIDGCAQYFLLELIICVIELCLAAALFYVEGDIFENQLKPQYLNTAIFITKNLAIASK